MPPHDRQAVQDAWSEIAEKSAVLGFDFAQGQWTYQQIVCPIFSRHIALLFSKGQQNDRSVFSAILPENSGENIRIIPVLRRGYSPLEAAPVNSAMIAAFNAVRAQEPHSNKVGWLTTSLCYAALAGAHLAASPADHDAVSPLPAPSLEIGADGLATVRIMLAEPDRALERWALTFDRSGRLLKVAISAFTSLQRRAVPPR